MSSFVRPDAAPRRARLRALASFFPLFSLVFLFAPAPRAAGLARQEPAAAPYEISYRLAMPRPETHLFEVTVEVATPREVESVDFQMPRWSPGRYAVYEFAKNVQEVRAETACAPNEDCEPVKLEVERLDTQTWRVRGAPRVRLSYKVFADDLSGTFSQLNPRHANFNGASLFVYVVGHKPDPVSLRINAPAGWKIVNGYSLRPDQSEWRFPNYDVMIDAPTELGPDWQMRSFEHGGRTYRVAAHSLGGGLGQLAALTRDVEKIVRAETAMMGAPDFESYTFLFHFDPETARGDGMEHLTSTQIIHAGQFNEEGRRAATETAAHEFFHVWNVKRLRPVELGPWDFTRPLATRSLWIAEGLTNYYGKMSLRRAGIDTDAQLYDSLASAIGTIEGSPGGRLMSAEEASLLAPFLDRASSEQRTNLPDVSVSYYPKGETLGLVLDLLIRGRTRGRASLDDVMRRMYEEFYLKSPQATYYLKGRGYTPADFERVASEVAGFDLSDFFRRHVRAPEPPPYEEALRAVGLRLLRASVGSDYRLVDDPSAPPEARALRAAWLKGTNNRVAGNSARRHVSSAAHRSMVPMGRRLNRSSIR